MSRPYLAPLGRCLLGASEKQWEATGRGGTSRALLSSSGAVPTLGTSAAELSKGRNGNRGFGVSDSPLNAPLSHGAWKEGMGAEAPS